MNIGETTPIVESYHNLINNQPCCVCHQANITPIIPCHSTVMKCNGGIHPQCFNLTESQTQEALHTEEYKTPNYQL